MLFTSYLFPLTLSSFPCIFTVTLPSSDQSVVHNTLHRYPSPLSFFPSSAATATSSLPSFSPYVPFFSIPSSPCYTSSTGSVHPATCPFPEHLSPTSTPSSQLITFSTFAQPPPQVPPALPPALYSLGGAQQSIKEA